MPCATQEFVTTRFALGAFAACVNALLDSPALWHWKGDYVRELSDEAVERHIAESAKSPSRLSLMHLYPINSAGGYVNFIMEDEGEERVRASYGDNYARLARIKSQYDPANLFRVNQNIRPAASAALG